MSCAPNTLRPIHVTLLMVLFACLVGRRCEARTCTSTDNGDWAAPGTWSCGSAPAAGDTIIIQAGHTVTVNALYTYTGTRMRVKIYGTLFFNGGGSKLNFPCSSIVEVMTPTATVTGNNSGSSQTIKICGTTFWAVSNGPVHGYTVWPTGSTLPVELLFFSAGMTGTEVVLTWATATEHSSDRFEVYRMRDGAGKELVATLPAAGNSLVRLDYRWADQHVSSGLWYYSLIQIDNDGTEADLGTRVVNVIAHGPIVVWPNPAAEGPVIIRWQGGDAASLRLVDLMGRSFTPVIRSASPDQCEIDPLGLAPGTYELRLEGAPMMGARFLKL
jgi:hypothetical protein